MKTRNIHWLRLSYLIVILFYTIPYHAVGQRQPDDLCGYLFAYFEGAGDKETQEQLRFACSADAIHWTALNSNKPIIPSQEIASSGGIRDPHILRGEHPGNYYLVATDMNTMKNGWESNPGIVLMHSSNLLDWKHCVIDLAKLYPEEFSNVKWVWAPQTLYDAQVGKYLVYFTVRFHHNNDLDFYAAYANEDFSGFESVPKLIFSPKFGGIDGDICVKDGIYHFFYKGNTKDEQGREIKNGIQQATSKSLWGPYVEDFQYIDAYADTSVVVEGSSVFKLNNTEEYTLMYDLYSDGRYEFQRSNDLYAFSQKPRPLQTPFHPRHGSVIGITKAEARALHDRWSGVPYTLLVPEEKGDTYTFRSTGNPLFTHVYTADPATLVDGGTLWLYTGHDYEGNQRGYRMKDWCVFSTKDMVNWTHYPTPLRITDFKWDKTGDAYAGHVVKRGDKYYWYISTNGSGIGVAVAERPEGPFKDALGKPLLTNDDCFGATHSWRCIDPAIFIDDDEQAWIIWGNKVCYYARLKENMLEIEGPIKTIHFPGFEFTEAPWIHKRAGKYYLSYATEFPEKIAYAMADAFEGPYHYKGLLSEIAGNSNTTHPAIQEFRNNWYFFYHNGSINPDGGSYSRAVCVEPLTYGNTGLIEKIEMSSKGVGGER
ncbi:hypothetical protein GCM10017764_18940 [Sphingobacterium griseoflavum]|uniref:1,4-beta-xylanase n=2 Tax=Sphingobacterium griseoflavum TaxID=1474952 RepID=A0ABQ3HUG9_9SPHI|nr:hypothetical protein GCM10017764_18940 [Sphingobacterium griseoflavum]